MPVSPSRRWTTAATGAPRASSGSDGVPLFVYGYSMGGLATVRLAERGDERFAGLIITGPALQTAASVPKPVLAIANALGRIAPNLPTIELDGDAISRVPAVRADYDADPLN